MWVGPAAGSAIGSRGGSVGRVRVLTGRSGSRRSGAVSAEPGAPADPAATSVAPTSGGLARTARLARAWYSGPCLRGSAYSFGLSVQYVPLVVPYQLAPRQSGSNGPSAPS